MYKNEFYRENVQEYKEYKGMSVLVQLLSGELESFEIFDGYTVSNLRDNFYKKMSKNLSIKSLKCIILFEDEDVAILNDFVKEGQIYRVLINDISVSIFYDETRNTISLDHNYDFFPRNAIVQIDKSVQENYNKFYKCVYDDLVQAFDEEIEFKEYDTEDTYQILTFKQYSQNKYGNSMNLEDIIKEYITHCIIRNFNIKYFIYL